MLKVHSIEIRTNIGSSIELFQFNCATNGVLYAIYLTHSSKIGRRIIKKSYRSHYFLKEFIYKYNIDIDFCFDDIIFSNTLTCDFGFNNYKGDDHVIINGKPVAKIKEEAIEVLQYLSPKKFYMNDKFIIKSNKPQMYLSIGNDDLDSIIGFEQYKNNERLKLVRIRKNIKRLEDYCFAGCKNLEHVVFESTRINVFRGALKEIEYFGKHIFDDCVKLNFNVKNNCLYLGNFIDPYVLCYKPVDKSITNVDICEYTTIAPECFKGCINLSTVTIFDCSEHFPTSSYKLGRIFENAFEGTQIDPKCISTVK